VVVSGSSAGGLATYVHLDHIASRMPASAVTRGVPVVGWWRLSFFTPYF
jgi:hypothetical protein